jgi:hypothetical protein
MHTTHLGKNWIARHNGDFSGEVILIETDSTKPPGKKSIKEITVPYDCIRNLVAEQVRSEVIGKLEQMEPYEVFRFMQGT